MKKSTPKVLHYVAQSTVHGKGVFAACAIKKGTTIMEYTGKRISQKKADALWPVDPDNPFHTFYFSLSSGKIIDGGQKGNDARWINHSCNPNCETEESADGKRVYILAKKNIKKDQELFFDYCLITDEKITDELKQNYKCCCGSANCRGTMLLLEQE
ncbi:SET domain-containing protein [Brackiella oedipodis]|uniref:SET domain-containing protein n=1 Tax=Brackiella oedipodis TaxID=124225 RepID=UPI00049122F5|nr:SET domain-containing protein-lysine N-methyltransferase [Brackiella oedipodis]